MSKELEEFLIGVEATYVCMLHFECMPHEWQTEKKEVMAKMGV